AGMPQSMIFGYGDTLIPNDVHILAGYLQDQYRVNTKLTINAGLRFDLEAYKRVFEHDPRTDRNNFGPRLGVAYAFSPHTAVHAAGGVFYGQIFGSLLQNNRQAQARRQYTVDGAAARALWLKYGNNMDGRANRPSEEELKATPGVGPIDLAPGVASPDLDSPYSYQGSVGVQHQFAENFAVKASYLYVGSRHEGVGRDTNYTAPLFFEEGQAMPNGLVAPPGGGYFYDRSKRIDLTYNRINIYEPRGYSDYHGLALTLQRRFSRSFGFDVAYTASVAKGNGEQFGGTAIPDDIDFDYGYAANHTPHRFVANGVWDMALGASPLLRDWQLSGIFVYQSGRTATVTYNTPNNCFGLIGCQIRPPQYLERGAFFNDGSKTVDLRISRSFRLGGERRLHFSADVFNIFNWEQFAVQTGYGTYPWRVNADGSIPAKPDFSVPGPGSTFGERTRVINQVRQAQLGVRFSF
nr:TonB-dependent receptor [Acidobacteriota bacterium]